MDKPILGLVAEQCTPKSLSKLSCSAGDEHYIPAALGLQPRLPTVDRSKGCHGPVTIGVQLTLMGHRIKCWRH